MAAFTSLPTGNNNLASFILPQRNSTPVALTNNGWTLSPATGAYFFARSSVSVGHLFPSTPALDDGYRFPRPNVVFGRTKPPPSTLILYHPPLLPTPAPLHKKFQMPPPFSTSLASTKCFLLTFFNALPLTLLIALTLPHFCAEHIPVLQTPQVLSTLPCQNSSAASFWTNRCSCCLPSCSPTSSSLHNLGATLDFVL